MARLQNRGRPSVAGASLIALLLVACSVRPEQVILDQFFSASRLRDRTALQHLSTVVFEPKDQGIVTAFDITGVTIENRGGERVSKNVSLGAHVKLPNGQIVEKKLAVTMQYAAGRWTITGVAVFPSSPRP
jgi:hypothetical protein